MHCQQTRRKRLAVHTGLGNETFCREVSFCKKSFFVILFNLKEELIWNFFGAAYCQSHGSRS